MECYTKKTIQSYIEATLLLEAVGTRNFQEKSIAIYGRPGNLIPGTQTTNIAAAQKLLEIAEGFDHPFIKEPEVCYTAEAIAEEIAKGATNLKKDMPQIRFVDNFAAKAAASLSTIKLRKGTCYTKYDGLQLLVHEVLTHSLTAINGSKQSCLLVMSRGAPRTTATQEGLATFSEVVTGAIDLKRLIRLALRIIAIENALNGANFLEVFEFFLGNGQSEKESFWATARIFRGGKPEGGIIFTKDNVYLDGLLKINSLFQWALHTNRPITTHLLFCGRIAIEDIFLLEKSLEQGLIEQPFYLPPWYENIESLAGTIAFSILNTLIDLKSLSTYFNQLEHKST